VPFIIETTTVQNYGGLRALADVNVPVPPGTIGLLGPNGAGRAPLSQCLLNLTPPTSARPGSSGATFALTNATPPRRVGYSRTRFATFPAMAVANMSRIAVSFPA